jgi:hypothetical protein
MNPKATFLRGLPKVHKDGTPIRPLVDYTTAPTFKLAKKLESILKNHMVLNNSYSLKNSFDLIDKTKHLNVLPHQILASFDIVNLYTNVPVHDTLALVDNILRQSNLLPEAVDELMILLHEVLNQNYFEFDGKYFSQTDGLAMGSPLSGVLADVYLNHIENKFIFSDKNKSRNKILFYHRYVDDTLLLFNGNARQLSSLHDYLNNLSPKLKFTLELENLNKINFLDVTVEKTNNKLDFSIFRKPTTSSQTIHAMSYHPYSQKFAAYNSMVHRLLNMPLSLENYNKEVRIIKHIALDNGYKTEMINKLIWKHKNKNIRLNNTLDSNQDKKYVCVEFSDNIQYGLNKILDRQGVRLAFRTTNRTRNLLKNCANSRPSCDKSESTGVYKIGCNKCECFYIGQTGRSFITRFKEHKPDPRLNKQKSSFAQHVIDENHSMGDFSNDLEILHICKKGRKLDTLEEFEIYRHFSSDENKESVLNEKLQFSSHSIFNTIIGKRNNCLLPAVGSVADDASIQDNGVT